MNRAGAEGGNSQDERVRVLREVALFSSLPEPYLEELAAHARRQGLAESETLFLEGDKADRFYVVISGRVKVFKTSPRGREQILMIMRKGDPIGEVAVLCGEPYPANAEALERSELVCLSRRTFVSLVAREPEVAMRLLGALSSRLRLFTALIEDLALREVTERLAAHLLVLLHEAGGAQALKLPLSKTQLAAAMGTVPETLSRAFRQLALAGALETRGRAVQVHDKSLLEEVARGGRGL